MYKKVKMPPPRALSSSPHMLDIDLLNLSTACSLPEPVHRYGSLLFARSECYAGWFVHCGAWGCERGAGHHSDHAARCT